MNINAYEHWIINFIIVLLASLSPVDMQGAETSFSMSVSQGFNFEPGAQVPVGHITALGIGDTILLNDFSVTDPEDISNTTNVVCVMSSIYWGGIR